MATSNVLPRTRLVIRGDQSFAMQLPASMFHVWMPLPEVLPVSHGEVQRFSRRLAPFEFDAELEVSAGDDVFTGSIRFFQTSIPRTFDDLMGAAHLFAPPPVNASSSAALDVAVTVAEVVVPGWVGGEPSEDQISDAFDDAVDLVAQFQRSIQAVQGGAMQMARCETLPTFVTVAVRPVDLAPDDLDWSAYVAHFQPNWNLPYAGHPEPLGEEARQRARVYNNLSQYGGLGTAGLTHLMDSRTHLLRFGDTRASALSAATFVETWLDHVFAGLLWEAGVRPDDAAPLFDQLFVSRLRREAPRRIGGNWDTSAPGPVAEWFMHCAQLRNRVIHRGYEPTRDEARHALRAAEELVTFTVDNLAANVARSPRVAFKVVSREGLEQRGAFTRRVRELVADRSEPDWDDLAECWRTTMWSCTQFSSNEVPLAARCDVAFVVRGPGPLGAWCLFDPLTRMGAVTSRPSSVSMERVVPILQAFAGHRAGDPRAIKLGGAVADDIPYDWVPAYRLARECPVMLRPLPLDDVPLQLPDA